MQEQQMRKESRETETGPVHVIPAPTPAEAPAWNPAPWRNAAWGAAPTWAAWPATGAGPWRGTLRNAPKCDIADEGGEFVCQIELPGVRAEDVEVVSFERALLVDAPRGPADESHGGVVLQAERGAGVPVHRTIPLPQEVRPSAVTATLRDGVLTVRLPKAEPAEGAWRIDVGH